MHAVKICADAGPIPFPPARRRKLVRRHLAAAQPAGNDDAQICRQRVLIVAHQVTVNCMRYPVEQMDEATILDIDRLGDIPNCSVTSCCAVCGDDGNDEAQYQLNLINFLAPLLADGTPVTTEPDPSAAPSS